MGWLPNQVDLIAEFAGSWVALSKASRFLGQRSATDGALRESSLTSLIFYDEQRFDLIQKKVPGTNGRIEASSIRHVPPLSKFAKSLQNSGYSRCNFERLQRWQNRDCLEILEIDKLKATSTGDACHPVPSTRRSGKIREKLQFFATFSRDLGKIPILLPKKKCTTHTGGPWEKKDSRDITSLVPNITHKGSHGRAGIHPKHSIQDFLCGLYAAYD